MGNYMGRRREWYVTRCASERSGTQYAVEEGPIERQEYVSGPFQTYEEAVESAHVRVHDGHEGGKVWVGFMWQPCWLGYDCPSMNKGGLP